MVLIHAAVGALKITNPQWLDKKTQSGQLWPRGRFFAYLLLLLLSLPAPRGFALPVTIAWDLPLIHAETYLLEIAATPGFAVALLKTEVKGTGYTGEVPAEGVYHWRLSRPGMTSESSVRSSIRMGDNADQEKSSDKTTETSETSESGTEKSTLASGSFVALDPDVKRLEPPRITWAPVPGAERYKIYMLGANATQSVVTVSSPSFLLPRVEEPLMLEVVPFSEGRRASRAYHLDPTLTLISGAPVAPAAAIAAPAPQAATPQATPVSVTVDPPRRRYSLVYLFGMGVQETLELQKLELDLKSTSSDPGGGGGFWLNPAYGLILSGQADYHEHNNPDVTQQALYPGRHLTIDESRFTADASVGYNLLDFFGVKRAVLAVSGTAAVVQLPMVPPESAVAPPAVPGLNKERMSLLGGSLALGYLGSYVSVMAEAAGLTDQTNKARLNHERLLIDLYPTSLLSIELGFFNRNTSASRCAASPALCLTVGASQVQSHEAGFFLGLGAVLL